ncbi:uncharacterized protein LOC116348369 [Contarinia nasturtii]|uniref:uncharacterized protein LOC116348369 n=1 Tax=Contarinia nasturtii TaxID=265458 RepID=UPI0012D41F3C|nr:uncharacterized protein LOC116348369 [Contarinia nasturtii]
MMFFLYNFFVALFLNECNGAPGGIFGGGGSGKRSLKEFNVDDFKYSGDPVTFACVTMEDQHGFDFFKSENGSMPTNLTEQLDNGRSLSLFFHGVGNIVSFKYGLLFGFAQEWFSESENNICVVSYAYTTKLSIGLQFISNLNKMVTTKRLEFVARLARDVVLGVRQKCLATPERQCLRHLSQVDVSGFSFGAHVAGRTCEYLEDKTGEKVRMLLALDPSKTPLFMRKPSKTIKKGHADYVQVIHTSIVGISDPIGDTDIFVKYTAESLSETFNDKHSLAFYIHVATATKRLYLLGEENGNGTLVRRGRNAEYPEPKSNECLVGIYGKRIEGNVGREFVVSLKNRTDLFQQSLDRYHNHWIFFER